MISEERLSQLGEDINIEDQFRSVNLDGLEAMADELPREEETGANFDTGMKLNVLYLIIEHAENPLIEVRAGVPEIPRPSRSEDEEIERLLR